MIDLKNTCVLVRTKEENEMLLKEAEKQGFRWYLRDYCEPLQAQYFPDILRFYEYNITYAASVRSDFAFYEASELLGTKEMSAREFAERIADVSNCCERECIGCVLDNRNNKCNTDLCNTRNWEKNIDELLEIAKVGKGTVPTPEEKAVEDIEKFIENPEIDDEEEINIKPEEAKDILSDMRDQHLCFLESSENKDEWQKKYLKEAWACDSGAKALAGLITGIKINKGVIAESILHYGKNNQSTVCMEECAELIQAISKAKRGKIDRDNMIEEIADVLICIEMLKQMYMISDEKINKQIKKKQAREVKRISQNELL